MEIHIIDRIPIGFALGWSYFPPEKKNPIEEITFHLILVDIKFLW